MPFRIKRRNWTMPDVFILVEDIVINKWPYGRAYGKSMNINEKGEEVVSDFQHHCKNGIIGCAGCYQWEIFEKNTLTNSGL